MGVSGQDSKVSWQTTDLPFKMAIFVIEQLVGRVGQQHRTRGIINANLVGYKHTHNRSPFAPDGAVGQVARAFSEELIDMHIICDHPTKRDSSKRASCQQQAAAEKRELQLIISRNELQLLLNTSDDSAEHAAKISNSQKKIVGLENALKRQQLPSAFVDKCSKFVSGYNSYGKGKVTFEVAPTQADPCVAKMAVDGDVDFLSYLEIPTLQCMLNRMDKTEWEISC